MGSCSLVLYTILLAIKCSAGVQKKAESKQNRETEGVLTGQAAGRPEPPVHPRSRGLRQWALSTGPRRQRHCAAHRSRQSPASGWGLSRPWWERRGCAIDRKILPIDLDEQNRTGASVLPFLLSSLKMEAGSQAGRVAPAWKTRSQEIFSSLA